MKHLPLILVFSLLCLTGCLNSSTKKSNSSTNTNTLCSGANYYLQGCPGYGGTTGGSTGTPGTGTNCYSGNNYYCVQGCPGYGQYPQACGGTTPPTNTCPSCSTTGIAGWTGKYPGGVPAGSCQPAYAPSGISYTPYETRKATMTIVGKTWYNPADPVAPNYLNTSSLLRSVSGSRQLFTTDSVLKVRFKVNQQPESSSSSPYCYGRQSGSSIAGYHQLQFNVQIVGMRANGTTETEPVGTFTVGVNSCTPAIDLSNFTSTYPGGLYVIVQSVKGNQAYFPDDYYQYGFKNVTGFVDIRSQDCWTLDVEVAADGTKTFD